MRLFFLFSLVSGSIFYRFYQWAVSHPVWWSSIYGPRLHFSFYPCKINVNADEMCHIWLCSVTPLQLSYPAAMASLSLCHPAASKYRTRSRKRLYFIKLFQLKKKSHFPSGARQPIGTDDVTRVLVLQSLRRVKSPESQVDFISAKVLSDICLGDRPGEIIGIGSLSLCHLVTPLYIHTRLSWCAKCGQKLVCDTPSHLSVSYLQVRRLQLAFGDDVCRRCTHR